MYYDPTGHYLYPVYNPETGQIEQHESDVIVDANHPYDDYGVPNSGIFVYDDTDHINASNSAGVGVYGGSTVGEVEVSAGSTANITNNGTIGTITTGAGSNTTIGNNGSITVIQTGSGSYTAINNNGYIGIIYIGSVSTSIITNNCYIGEINTGEKSTNGVSNYAYIGSIYTGLNNSTVIGDNGYISYAGGNGKIIYTSNRATIGPDPYADIRKTGIIDAREYIDPILGQMHYGFWHGGNYLLVQSSCAYFYYNNLKNTYNGYKFQSEAISTAIIPVTIYESYKEAQQSLGPVPPFITLGYTAVKSIADLLSDEDLPLDDGIPEGKVSEILDALERKIDNSKSIAIASAQYNYIMKTDYRYLMLDGEGRKEFLEQLDLLKESVQSKDSMVYYSNAENEAYMSSLVGYINKVIEMNKNSGTYINYLREDLKNIKNAVNKIDTSALVNSEYAR